MPLSDFFLSVMATAFRGADKQQADAVKAIERDFGIRPDRAFWERYLKTRVPKIAIEQPPIGSFRIPPDLRADFRNSVAKPMIFGHLGTGFHGLNAVDREAEYRAKCGKSPTFATHPVYGHVIATIAQLKIDHTRATETAIRQMSEAIGRNFDAGFLRGDGTNQPMGIVNSNMTLIVPRGPKLADNVEAMKAKFGTLLTGNHLWLGSTSITFWGVPKAGVGEAQLRWTEMMPMLLQPCCLMLVDPSWYGVSIRWEDVEIAAGIGAEDHIALFFAISGDGFPLPREFDEEVEGWPMIGLGEQPR